MTKLNDLSSEEENVLNLERILDEEVGQCGKFQLRVISLCALLALLLGLELNNFIFTFAKLNTRCMIPECETASTSELNFTPAWIHNALPASQASFDRCHRFGKTLVNTSDSCPAELFDRDSVIKCEEYVYEGKNSAYYEYNMACDDWRANLVGSIQVIGAMISLPIFGFIADHWGRRNTIVTSACIASCITCSQYWANSFTSYVVLAFCACLAAGGLFSCLFTLAVEFMGSKYRVAAGTTVTTFTGLGLTLQGLIAWTGLYWRHLILVLNAPLLIVIFYLWMIPESIRWLMSKGRYEESKAILQRAAKMNGKVLSEKTLKAFSEEVKLEKKKKGASTPWLVSLVFSHKRVLLYCVLTPIWWITLLFVFYGLTMSSVGVSGNKYLNYCAVTAIEIPGHWIALLLLNRTGRKPLAIAGYWICGMFQIAYILVPIGYYWLSLAIYLAGKLSISVVVTTLYVYTAELYPTQYRATLMTYSSMLGRLGAILAPLTPALSSVIWEPLPFVLFAGMAFLSGLLVLLAPETLGTTLPDSMEEANNLGKGKGTPSRILQPLRELVFRRKCYTIR